MLKNSEAKHENNSSDTSSYEIPVALFLSSNRHNNKIKKKVDDKNQRLTNFLTQKVK